MDNERYGIIDSVFLLSLCRSACLNSRFKKGEDGRGREGQAGHILDLILTEDDACVAESTSVIGTSPDIPRFVKFSYRAYARSSVEKRDYRLSILLSLFDPAAQFPTSSCTSDV